VVEEDAEQFALGGLHAGGAAEDCSVELDEKQACIQSVVAANSTARMSDLNIIDPFPVHIIASAAAGFKVAIAKWGSLQNNSGRKRRRGSLATLCASAPPAIY
jgi:hypothetical protein